jgi:hypothetical protein
MTEKKELPDTLNLSLELSKEIDSCTEAKYSCEKFMWVKSQKEFRSSTITLNERLDFDIEVINFDLEIKADYLFLTLCLKGGNELKFCPSFSNFHNLNFILGILHFENLAIKDSDEKTVLLSDAIIKKFIKELKNKMQSNFNFNQLLFRYILLYYSEYHRGMEPEAFLKTLPKEVFEYLENWL